MLSTLSAFVLQSIIGQVGNSERIFDLQLKGYQAMQQGRYSEALETIRKTYPLYGDESNGISGSAYLEAKALLLLGRYEEAGLAFKKGLYWTGDDFQVSGHYFETWVIGFYLPEYSEYLARVGRHEDAKLLLYCGIEQTQSFQYRFNFGGDTDTLPYTLKNVRAVCGVMKALVLESSVALGISDIDFREYLKSSINESGDWFLPWLLLANSEPNSNQRTVQLKSITSLAKTNADFKLIRMAKQTVDYKEFQRKLKAFDFLIEWRSSLNSKNENSHMNRLMQRNWSHIATLVKP